MAKPDSSDAGGMPQLEFDNWASQIFWVAIALFLLYQILAKRIMPRIATALEDRHHAIADDLDSAAELKHKAEGAQASYQQALADAKARANEIAEKTKVEIAAQVEEANVKAEAEIAARTAEGEQRIAEIRAAAAASAKQVAQETAQAIVEKLAPGSADTGTISAAVERALAARGMAQ
jgi:F-type H+-transporting ATPase subunit b